MDSILSHDVGTSPLGRIAPAMGFVRSAERWAIRNSSLVMTITPRMADHVRQIAPGKSLAVVPDIPLPNPEGGPDPDRVRSQLPADLIDGRKLIVYTGSSANYQGLDLLISAIPKVTDRYPNTAFLVIGGESSDLCRLRQQSEKMGIVNNPLFLGKKPPEEIPHFLSLADILVSPRRSGMNPPAKIYTYMQCGKPMVVTDIPAHTAVLSQETAILTQTGADEFAEGIIWALAHPEEARRGPPRPVNWSVR